MSDGSRQIQRSPEGWEAYYGAFLIGNGFGKMFYTTECICRNSRGPKKKMCATPHKLREWADEHGNHRPEYQILKPRPEEYFPDGGKGRTKHPGYKKYQERMQSLGFYTSVRMLEKNGFRLPDQAQEKWNHIRHSAQQVAELTEARRRGHQGRNLRRHESPADEFMSEDESDAEVTAEEESGVGVSTRTAEVSSGNGGGANPSSKKDSDVCYINASKRQKTEGAPLNGNNSGLQRKAKRASIAAHADTEAPTAMYTDASAGPPHHTEQLMEKIRLIQEMLPEYGMGFLAACLRAGGYVVASVVEQLLDDSWRQVPELRYLDPSEPLHQYSLRRRRRTRRTSPEDKQCKGSGARLGADCQAAHTAIVPARSAKPPETPDQTKEKILRAVYPETWAARAAMQPSSAPGMHDQATDCLRPSAQSKQASQDCAEETTPGASLPGLAAPSADGRRGPVAPVDPPCPAAWLTRSTPNQDGRGTPQTGQRPDQALCGVGPADHAASDVAVLALPAAQSPHKKTDSGRAGEMVDLSAPVGTDCAAPSDLEENKAKVGCVDPTPDSPRTSCTTQLPAALSNLNVIQGRRVEGGPSVVADQAQYMPSTAAVLPPAFAYPMQAMQAASRAGECSLDDVIADLSTLKASWDSGAASAGRRFSFDSILQCLHLATLRERLAQQQEATITRLRACASAGEQRKQAVISQLRGRVEALEGELAILRDRAEKGMSMLASKNKEIKALRSQVDVYEAS